MKTEIKNPFEGLQKSAITTLCIVYMLFSFCFSCRANDDDTEPEFELLSDADFESFTFAGAVEGSVNINHTDRHITAMAAPLTDMKAIVPEFTLSQGAKASVDGVPQISGETKQNFNEAVEYAVMAEDAQTVKTWTVTIHKESFSDMRWIAKKQRIYAWEWRFRELTISGELPIFPDEMVDIEMPDDDAVYSNYSMDSPDFDVEDGVTRYVYGNSFYNSMRISYEINERQQIKIGAHEYSNRIWVTFKEAKDWAGAEEFAANSGYKIVPGEDVSMGLRWIFHTDGTEIIFEIADHLKPHPDVERLMVMSEGEAAAFGWNLFVAVKFMISDHELIFFDVQDKPLILFEKELKKQ